jgi:hypothetical protein
MFVIPAMRGSTNRRTEDQASSGIKGHFVPQISKAKRVRGMAQVVEHLSSRYEALNSYTVKTMKKGVHLKVSNSNNYRNSLK